MIYDLIIRYGAKIDDKVIYSLEQTFEDCLKVLTEESVEKMGKTLQEIIKGEIKKDGFNPENFVFDFLTKDEYLNQSVEQNTRTFDLKDVHGKFSVIETTPSELKPILIDRLIEMLESAKERLGNVPVYAWDSSNENNKPFALDGLNAEGDHVELTN